MKKGSHPDTDSDFWSGYKETPRPTLRTWLYGSKDFVVVTESIIFTSPLILLLVWLVWRRRKNAAARLPV